jgi:atypical dual specificity phosphatase
LVTKTSLALEGFGVAYHGKTILRSVTLLVPARGLLVLVGPTGTGKSTLLRTLAGHNDLTPSVNIWGECRYRDRPLGAGNHPSLVVQHARLLTATLQENLLYELPERFASSPEQKRQRACRILEDIGLERLEPQLSQPVLGLSLQMQRRILLARVAVTSAALICVDEPTYGLDEHDVEPLLDQLRNEATRRALIVVLHNQKHIRSLGGETALLAGGVIQEHQPTGRFLSNPLSRAARQFVETGSCVDMPPTEVDFDTSAVRERRSEVQGPPAPIKSATLGPNGFVWLLPGRLAGTPQPGIAFDIDYDLESLRRVGVTTLLSLTEQQPDVDRFARFAIQSLWLPVRDMEAPSIEAATQMCALLERLLERGEVVSIHCKAGFGRTGTMLAAYLIWRGNSALVALETARRCEPRWVQSEFQIRFLEDLARTLGRQRETVATHASAPAAPVPTH